MFSTWNAPTWDDFNVKIWIECSENKEQTKDKQIVDSPIVTENSGEDVGRDESERYEDRVVREAYKIEVWRIATGL